MSRRLFFSVGEPSGDLHAANLIRSLRSQDESVVCRGFGGEKMMQAGFECDYDLTQMAVIGIVEVVPKLRQFFKIADQASRIFERGDVDGVVLVDFPGFNWHIAKRAKKLGLPVYYYMPPQLWAWGGWRVHKLRRTVDQVLCNLPFERDWFEEHQVNAEYVGHPFFDEVATHVLDPRFMHRWSRPDRLQVAILPGSRDHEVHTIWPLQLELIRRLHREFPKVEFLVAAYKDSHALWCRQQLKGPDSQLPIEIFVGKTSEILELSDCALIKSGSVSLELMARGTPAVVMYRLGRLTYNLIKLASRCKSISLPNLIAGEEVMPEFLSTGNPQKAMSDIETAMRRLIGDSDYRERQREKLNDLASKYAQPGASNQAASIILDNQEIPILPFRQRVA